MTIRLVTRSLSPAEAEVWIMADQPDVQLRGRLVGPTCLYSSTIEVAYPLRDLPQPPPGINARRVAIPEPSLWHPTHPFRYRAFIESRRGEEVVERIERDIGLRAIWRDESGVRWNGERMDLRIGTGTDLRAMRAQGCNVVVLDPSEAASWRKAERVGLAVIGRPAGDEALIWEAAQSPACLGWLVIDGIPDYLKQMQAQYRWLWFAESDVKIASFR